MVGNQGGSLGSGRSRVLRAPDHLPGGSWGPGATVLILTLEGGWAQPGPPPPT